MFNASNAPYDNSKHTMSWWHAIHPGTSSRIFLLTPTSLVGNWGTLYTIIYDDGFYKFAA